MHKINYNFNLLENKDDVYEQKIEWLKDQINDRIDTIERNSNLNDGNLGKSIEELKNQLDYIQPMYDISALIDEAIANANYDLSRYITETEFEDGIDQKLTGYVRSVDMDNALSNYVTSAAVQEMMADATTGNAYAQTIVANAEFYKEYNADRQLDCFVYKDSGTISGFANLEEYYNNPAVKNEVDPNNKGLTDENVVRALIRKAENTFETIYKQLALIKQSVTNSDASIDIMAAIQNPETGDDIVAAIFAKATETGSYVGINADQIVIDANHQLALNAGTFSINTDNFAIGTDGTVVARNINLAGGATAYNMETYYMKARDIEVDGMTAEHVTVTDMTATKVTMNNLTVNGIFANEITLNSKGGYTKIDENGILYAHGAQIDGNVTAKQFNASEEVSITTGDNYTGTVTKSTAINGSAFGMEVTGTLHNGNNTRDLTGNSLYIELVDELPNDGSGDITDPVLYGVPVLCMNYRDLNGVQHVYRLKPGSWMGDSTADTSKFRWYKQYDTDVLKYSFEKDRLSSSKYYTASLSSNFPGTLYIFSPAYRNTYAPQNNGIDTVYRLRVDSFGNDSSVNDRLNNLKTYSLVDSNSVTTSTVNDHTVYALKSSIDANGGTTYCGDAVGSTPITPELCTAYQSYLQSTISAGVEYRYTNRFASLTNDYGVNHIFEYFLRAAGTKQDGYGGVIGNNDLWVMEGLDFTNGPTRADIGGTQGFTNNVPFTTGGFYTSNGKTIGDQEFYYDVAVYPIVTINNNGKSASTTTNLVYAKCTFGLFGNYNNSYSGNNDQSQAPIKCNVGPYTSLVGNEYNANTYVDGEFIPETIQLTLSFDCMFEVSGMSFKPLLSTTKDTILNKMYSFLSSYAFEGNLKHNALNEHVQFEGIVTGKFKVRMNNSLETYDVVLTKNTVD